MGTTKVSIDFLKGMFDVAIVDIRLNSLFLVSFITVVLIGLFLVIDGWDKHSNNKKHVADNLLKSMKVFMICALICSAVAVFIGKNIEINNYKAKVYSTLESDNTGLDEIVELMVEAQVGLDFFKPKIINNSYYLEKHRNSGRNGRSLNTRYYRVDLVNEDNISDIISNYIENGVVSFGIYKQEINSKVYNILKQK